MIDHKNYNCEIFFDDGSSAKIFANWLHNNNLNYWKGWKCDAGVTRINIDHNFDVYSGVCLNDSLGNVFTDFDILEKNVCKRDRCIGCTDDLLVEKSKIND